VKELRVTGEVVEDTVRPNLYSFEYVSEQIISNSDGKLDKSIGVRNFKIRLYINNEEFYRFGKPKLINRTIMPLKEKSATIFSKKKDYVEVNSYLIGDGQLWKT